jgi:hypothetical protein
LDWGMGEEGSGGRTGCDVESEFPRLGQLAQAGAQAEEGVAADAGGEVGEGEADVVDLDDGGVVSLRSGDGCPWDLLIMGSEEKRETNARVVEAKDVAVAVVERCDQRLEVGAVVGELVKDDFRLGFGEGTHRRSVKDLVS